MSGAQVTWQEPGEKGNLATAKHGDLIADVYTNGPDAAGTPQAIGWTVFRPVAPGRAVWVANGFGADVAEAKRHAEARLAGGK